MSVAGSILEREITIGKLEVPLVIELRQSGRVWMVAFKVHIVTLGLRCGITALFANVNLIPSLLVSIQMSNSMDLKSVRFKRTSLSERFVAVVAFIRTDT